MLPAIECRDVSKVYRKGQSDVVALDGVTLDVDAGDFVALMGPSGSGKSTLLHLIAGLDSPTSGTIRVEGAEVSTLPLSKRTAWRARHIAFIFQSFNLIPVLTAFQNVDLALSLKPLTRRARRARVTTALELVQLADRADHYPHQLSYGQEQRVAIARALVSDAPMLLADEPTGNLDAPSADEVIRLFETIGREFKTTIIVVTHDPLVAARARTVRHLEKGRLRPLAEPALAYAAG
jgi:putative ABC transport system ATP-binding protein